MSASLLGALAGSAAAFIAGNRNSLGRRKELLLASVLYGEASSLPPSPSPRARARAGLIFCGKSIINFASF